MTFFHRSAMLAALVLTLCVGIAAAKEARKSSGLPVAATSGGLRAMIQIATAQEAGRFQQEWISTTSDHAPHLTTIEHVHRGERFSVLVFYGGCAPKGATEADLEARKVACAARLDLHIIDPAGKAQTALNDRSLSAGTPAAVDAMLQLSPLETQIAFEPEDPEGVYRIEATVDDPDSDRVVRVAATVELLPDAPAP